MIMHPIYITCTIFILLTLLYLHNYMIMHPIYDTFILFDDAIILCIHDMPSIHWFVYMYFIL